MTTLPAIQPKATMEEAWAESDPLWRKSDRLWAEGRRLREEGYQIVVVTAQALYGPNVVINWSSRTVTQQEEA